MGTGRDFDQAVRGILELAGANQGVLDLTSPSVPAAKSKATASESQIDEQIPAASGHHQKLFQKFGGIMHDVSRLYQHDIVVYLCSNQAVPGPARQRYIALRPTRMQELIRRRVGIEKELKALQQTAAFHYKQADKWHQLTALEGSTLGDIEVEEELQKVLSHKSRIGQALHSLEHERWIASTMQDTDFLTYADQVKQHFQLLDDFYDAYRKRYVPYVLAVSMLNRKAGGKPGRPGPSHDPQLRSRSPAPGRGQAGTPVAAVQQLQHLGDCRPQPPVSLDSSLLRYPPATHSNPPSYQELKRMRQQQAATRHAARSPPARRVKPSPLSPPALEDVRRPEALVHPTMFD